MRPSVRLPLILFLLAASASPALAAWPNSPFTNRAVTTAANQQFSPMSVSDGAGGAIVTWQDQRSGTFDIYAQHVLASGTVDPVWPVDGVALCTATNIQQTPTIVSDGAGGAIVTWQDNRLNASLFFADIYAQHVLASGVVDPAWPLNGRGLCTANDEQVNPTIASDGAGGAIVTWRDFRSSSTHDVYAQHVLASGAVDGAWPVDGRAVCTAVVNQQFPMIVSDGAGGAIITWQDYRSNGSFDVYAQRVLASGAVDGAWPADGRALSIAAGHQQNPSIVSDGAGGAIVTWQDGRFGTTDIFAQHVLASGAVDVAWPIDGRGLCTAANNQTLPLIVSDGAGGAIVTWNDFRTGAYDIYAQHVMASGLVDGAWPGDGRGLCTAVSQQSNPAIIPDGVGGAIVAWHDLRGATYDIYAQHVLPSGALEGAWPVDGRAVSAPSGEQSWPTITSDGAGGAIIAWQDGRNGTFDIYAQRLARYGYLGSPEAEIVSVTDVPNDQGGRVKLSWNASYLESDPYNLVTSYRVYRSVPPSLAVAMKAAGASFVRAEAEVGSLAQSEELLTTIAAGTTYYWEYLATVTADLLPTYSYLAATAQDSASAGAPTTAFMLQARTAGAQHWESLPMAGYSVDNLPPAAPEALIGQYLVGSTVLQWEPNTEADLAGYRLYRGTLPSFVPGPGNLIATLPEIGYVDAFATPSYYKLTAIDSHGNESPVATLSPPGTVDVEVSAPVLAFSAPAPNPAVTRTTLQYSLPGAGTVRLGVYDASGRLMRELAGGAREAGSHVETWDLRDASGRMVGAGLYFARLETDGGTLVRRVAVRR